jgi:tetratricopeptide (TPR) repeat protein
MARRAAEQGPARPPAEGAKPAPSTRPRDDGPRAPHVSPSSRDEGVPLGRVTELLDRLAAAEEAQFVRTWIEALSPEGEVARKLEPGLAVRLLRAYRETGSLDRARELSSEFRTIPAHWPPADTARLALERAMLAILDGRVEEAEEGRAQAARALAHAPSGTGLREQLDIHLVAAELELRRNDVTAAARSLRLAEHVAERLGEGAFRVAVSMSLGHLAMRLADPRTGAKHYREALDRAPSRGTAAMRAHANLAIALGSTGAIDPAREHADAAVATAAQVAAGWRHADAYDVLAIVAIAADRPDEAIEAVESAFGILGSQEQPTLRYQLASHKTFALAAVGKGTQAKTWLAKTERLKAELGQVDAIDAQDLVATRARTLEASGSFDAAIDLGLAHVENLPHAFVTGTLNLVVGRSALAVGKLDVAKACIERVCLSGERHGWVFPERRASRALYELGCRSHDSRVVRYAQRILGQSSAVRLADVTLGPEGDEVCYVTTRDGVARAPRRPLPDSVGSATLVVDTLTHELRVGAKRSSLERRRALEPLVVELLRRAKEGLSAEEILRAAGGPGPDSADAEHRVRVLVSRVRDLLGDPALVTRVRDAGEHGKTRYRLADDVSFALVEPAAAGGG